jgi:hypothetical protein
MAITSLKRDFVDSPNIVRMETTNTLAQVEATGYLATQSDIILQINSGTWTWLPSDMILCYASDGLQLFTLNTALDDFVVYSTAGNGAVTLPVVSGNFTTFDGTLGALGDLGYSPSDATKTKVVMAGSAVQVGYIAHFIDTAGTIDDTAGNVINAGNIQAGLSGTAGTLISFPTTAANGSLIISALNAGGAFNTTIRNSVMGQSSVISIPDPGAATANFVLSASSGTQTITGNLTVSGAITSTAGNITSGSSGDAGTFISFPATAANGTLILAAINAGGAFNTTISNSTMGQSSVISIPDPGGATANFLISASAGTQTISTGNIALTLGYVQLSAVNGLTALAGGAQAGTALTRQINRVTTVATAADSVQLPLAVAGRSVTVINAAAANAMAVFPQTGEVINALAANSSISVAANKVINFYCAVAGTWNSLLTA